MRPFVFDRSWDFALDQSQLWEILTKTDEYMTWWSRLREFELGALSEGQVARFVVKAPLPYSLRFEVTIAKLIPAELVETHVSGDVSGPATLKLTSNGNGCSARVNWTLQVQDPLLRRVARFARPLMEWSHRLVVSTSVEQFRSRAIGDRG